MKRIHKSTPEERRQQRLLLKLKCVRLVQKGASASAVARSHGISPRAVSYWVTRFKLHNMEGLKDTRTRAGRRPRLDSSQMKKVSSFVKAHHRKEHSVTGIALSNYIKTAFDVNLTVQHCRRILKKIEALWGTSK